MQLSSLLGHTAELFRIINKSHQPPATITKDYLKAKKYLGSNDRKFISETLFTILRLKSLPEYCIASDETVNFISSLMIDETQKSTLSDILLIVFGIIAADLLNIPIPPIKKLIPTDDNFPNMTSIALNQRFGIETNAIHHYLTMITANCNSLLLQAENIEFSSGISNDDAQIAAIRYAQQEWVINSLINSDKYSSDDLKELFNSLLHPATLTLRINTPPSEHTKILNECKQFDTQARLTQFSPFGIHLGKRIDMNSLSLYKRGIIEVQDEGSQLITIALNPQEDEHILDACAGAGGKTLHIASLTNNKSRIIASDIELIKLKELNKRSRRAGSPNIQTFLPKHISKSTINQFDRVLIDAPCSGMGTVRRNPMLKWQLTPKLLEKYNAKQYRILEQYADYVASDGVLLYSTCSILPQENEKIIAKFLKNHRDFSPLALKPAFDNYNIELPGLKDDDFQYQLLPSVIGSDGFYFAKLIRE